MYIPKLSYYFIDEVHPKANKKDTVFDGLANSVVASMKLQRTLSKEGFNDFMDSLKEKFKDDNQKIRFSTFMTFMFRLLSAKLHIKDFEKAQDLDEVIRMTKTFIDREIENSEKKGEMKGEMKGEKKGEKKGKISAFYEMIKQGLIPLDQAATSLGITSKQLLADFKEYNLVL